MRQQARLGKPWVPTRAEAEVGAARGAPATAGGNGSVSPCAQGALHTAPCIHPAPLALIPVHSPLRHRTRAPRIHSRVPQPRARAPTSPACRPITLAAKPRTPLRPVLAPGRAPQHPQCSAAAPLPEK